VEGRRSRGDEGGGYPLAEGTEPRKVGGEGVGCGVIICVTTEAVKREDVELCTL
jgi:hypothetical protein